MGVFRSRPKKVVEVHAEQWFAHKPVDGVLTVLSKYQTSSGIEERIENVVRPPNWPDSGSMIVRPGDWIVTSPSGVKYPMNPYEFAAQYEPAPEGERTSSPAIVCTASQRTAACS